MLDWLWNALGCEETDAAGVGRAEVDAPPKVMINKQFITPNEQRLFHTLQRYYGTGEQSRGHVLAEVALNRLLWFPQSADRSKKRSWQNRIHGRSVDSVGRLPHRRHEQSEHFRRSLRPIVAIELDDKSHLTEKREQRDATVNTLCAAAGLRLVRVPGNVTAEELRAML